MTTPTTDLPRSRRDRLADLGEAMIAAYGRVCADEGVLFGVASRLAGVVDDVRRGERPSDADIDRVLADARRLGLLPGDAPDAQSGSALPLHRTEAGHPRCSTCDGGGCPDCTDPA